MMKLEVSEKEQVWAALSCPPDLESHPGYGDVYTLREFVDMCKYGAITSGDGCGSWATATHFEPRHDISLRKLFNGEEKRPAWATHILWFNK